MRRYRNARYAPESLERKLNPSGVVVASPPAEISPTVQPSDYIPAAPTLVSPSMAPSDTIATAPALVVSPSVAPSDPSIIVDDSEGYGFDGTDYTVDYSTADDSLPYTAPMSDYLLVDDSDVPPPPGEGPAPILPPLVPTGPVVPA